MWGMLCAGAGYGQSSSPNVARPGTLQALASESTCTAGGDSQHKLKQQLHQADVRLETGRTHQIRAQLSAHGVPLLRDTMYTPLALCCLRRASQQMQICLPRLQLAGLSAAHRSACPQFRVERVQAGPCCGSLDIELQSVQGVTGSHLVISRWCAQRAWGHSLRLLCPCISRLWPAES